MEHKDISSEKTYDSEKVVEKRLVKGVEQRGGMCIKMICSLHTGLPDRLVLFKGHIPVFVELKTTGKKPKRIQTIVHNKIRTLGIPVYVFDSVKQVDDFLNTYDVNSRKLTQLSEGDC